MKTYDDTSWHLGADYPAHISQEGAATPMGLFFAWSAHRGLTGAAHLDDFEEELEGQLLKRAITPGQYILMTTAGDLTEYDFNEEGNDFADAYYGSGQYHEDLREFCSAAGVLSLFELPDTWATFDQLHSQLDARYADWQASA